MTIHYNQNDNYLLASSLDLLRDLGVTIQTGTDFEEYRQVLSLARPDHDLGVPFDPLKQPLTPDTAYWMVGYDAEGSVMHTQALKKLELGAQRLGEYMQLNLPSFEPSKMDIDYDKTVYRPGPGAQRMDGAIVYHGEFWVGGKAGQFRGTGLSSILGRHAFLTAMLRWSPDYFFGFMSKPLVYKGFSARFGYLHTEPEAIRYVLKGTSDVFEGLMGYMTNEDLRFVLNMPVADLVPQAA
ncbi:MAG: hypothetical protein AAF636_18785 [Pseudomonadota bacterium]